MTDKELFAAIQESKYDEPEFIEELAEDTRETVKHLLHLIKAGQADKALEEIDNLQAFCGYCIRTKRIKGFTVMCNRFFVAKEEIQKFVDRLFDDGHYAEIKIEALTESEWKENTEAEQ